MKIYLWLGTLAVLFCLQGNAVTARDIRNDTTPTILTYGFRIMELERARNVVAQKYGFRFFTVAGCIVTQQLMDSINKENDATYAILEKQLGKNWEKRFDNEVEKVKKIQYRIEALAMKEAYIIARQQELAKHNNNLYFLITPLPNSREWEVKAYGWETEEYTEQMIFYKMKADLRRKKIELLSSKVEKMPVD